MTRAEMEALALRVEREEPSEELNGAINALRLGRPVNAFDIVLQYLRSLDAAASLMPRGWWLKELGGASAEGYFYVLMVSEHKQAEGYATAEPRARTAAALRAQAMEMPE